MRNGPKDPVSGVYRGRLTLAHRSQNLRPTMFCPACVVHFISMRARTVNISTHTEVTVSSSWIASAMPPNTTRSYRIDDFPIRLWKQKSHVINYNWNKQVLTLHSPSKRRWVQYHSVQHTNGADRAVTTEKKNAIRITFSLPVTARHTSLHDDVDRSICVIDFVVA